MKKTIKWLLSSGVKMLAIIIALNISIALIARNSQFEWVVDTYAAPIAKTPPAPELSLQEQVIGLLKDAGLTWPEIAKAIAIIECESNWNPYAINTQNRKGLGLDLGLWQLNTKFNPDTSRECMFSVECSTKRAIEVYKARKNWSAWICS